MPMHRDIKSNSITAIYFSLTVVLLFIEFFKLSDWLVIFKPLLIPSLIILYLTTAKGRCYWYVFALVFAFISNVFFLSTQPTFMLFGILSFLVYRIATIITVVQIGDKVALLPLVLATIPFLFVFSYLIYMMISPMSANFYPTVINDIIISLFSGLGLANYVMNDNKQNSWLIISTLLFTFLVILFMVENFYLSNPVFKPLSALVFSLAHYAFYLFVYEAEHQTKIDLP